MWRFCISLVLGPSPGGKAADWCFFKEDECQGQYTKLEEPKHVLIPVSAVDILTDLAVNVFYEDLAHINLKPKWKLTGISVYKCYFFQHFLS